MFKIFDNMPCIKNGKVDYLTLTIKGITNPAYLSNLTIFIGLFAFLTKNVKLMNIINPLLITNGTFICIYSFMFLKKLELQN